MGFGRRPPFQRPSPGAPDPHDPERGEGWSGREWPPRQPPAWCRLDDDQRHRAPIAALQHYVRARMHRRLFLWFGASIAMTGATVVIVLTLFFPEREGPREQYARWQGFVGGIFAPLWDDPVRRGELAESMAAQLDVGITLEDVEGRVLAEHGAYRCHHEPQFSAPVTLRGRSIGVVQLCNPHHVKPWGLIMLAFFVAGGMLWAASGIIARRIAKPVWHVAAVAREIGEGKLDARVHLERRYRVGEIRVLGDALNEMAARIQKQLEDQRELLAAVSHELRTPLGHLRILLEMARDSGTDAKLVDELEREIMEVDDLVGELLASSRLTFDTLSMRPVEGLDLGARALERHGLSLDLLASSDDAIAFPGDATLLGRALANLLENAKRYGDGVDKLEVERRPVDASRTDVPAGSTEVVFAVCDRGPGFAPDDVARVFDPFYRGEHRAGAAHASLGLGLSLVSRIAQAHGGRAWAENRAEGGARVCFSVLVPPSEPGDLRSTGSRLLAPRPAT